MTEESVRGVPTPEVAVVAIDDDRLLLVRRGIGPAGGVWDLPSATVQGGELLAETLVRLLDGEVGLEGVCDRQIGVLEHLADGGHRLRIVFSAALLEDAEPVAGDGVAEARWISTDELGSIRLAPGLAGFLHDHAVLDILA